MVQPKFCERASGLDRAEEGLPVGALLVPRGGDEKTPVHPFYGWVPLPKITR